MSRAFPVDVVAAAFAAPLLIATALLSGCDGETADYTGERYDIVWTWVDGNVELNIPAVFGTEDAADASNQPGARQGAMRWKDAAGNFWLFGGIGFDTSVLSGRLHDLWKYDPVSGLWTWVGGANVIGGTVTHSGAGIYTSATATDLWPGARNDAITWTDASGDFWLFGGQGHDRNGTFGRLNDLWKYSVATGLWTWVSGSDVINQAGVYAGPATLAPGARFGGTGWADSSGALWLFGGSGFDAAGACCFLNDLWKYSGGNWTWEKGSSSKDPAPVYGTQNVAAAANTPSGRFGGVSWYDSTGTAWIYGGTGNMSTGSRYVSAELWKYTATGWVWVSGEQSTFITPVYNNRGEASATALPGSRRRATAWTGNDGSLYLFGGDSETAGGFVTNRNDLWLYVKDPNNDGVTTDAAWSWLGGKQTDNPAGNYVALGSSGQPGGRAASAGWVANDGKLWLFGGEVDEPDTTTIVDFIRNDLWYFEP